MATQIPNPIIGKRLYTKVMRTAAHVKAAIHNSISDRKAQILDVPTVSHKKTLKNHRK